MLCALDMDDKLTIGIDKEGWFLFVLFGWWWKSRMERIRGSEEESDLEKNMIWKKAVTLRSVFMSKRT